MFTPEQSGRMLVKPPVRDIGVTVHLPPDQLADLDRWIRDIARRMGNEPSGRSEAIRDILQNHFDTQRQLWAREDAQKSKPAKRK
jgi:metal-responsive CopG/Arc/MetJ family transcriptional regulator